ncbi:MAG: 4Fe-4S dicluster domain-containing protein [Candidatus Hodarchaeales archaeon]|jgi:ferredoxin
MRCNKIPPSILIDNNLCILCLKCVKSCPAEILVKSKNDSKNRKGIIMVTEPTICFECRACEVVCSEAAIKIMCEIRSEVSNPSTS